MLFKMEVLAFEVFNFEVWIVDYLMSIDEKFLSVNSFCVVYVFELIDKSWSLFWDDLERKRDNLIEF